MLKELGPGFRLTLIFTILTGLLYPAVMTGVSELIFPKQANGSLVTVGGKVVGSSLIGQPFAKQDVESGIVVRPRACHFPPGICRAHAGGEALHPE